MHKFWDPLFTVFLALFKLINLDQVHSFASGNSMPTAPHKMGISLNFK